MAKQVAAVADILKVTKAETKLTDRQKQGFTEYGVV
jgi:hypothetical protein